MSPTRLTVISQMPASPHPKLSTSPASRKPVVREITKAAPTTTSADPTRASAVPAIASTERRGASNVNASITPSTPARPMVQSLMAPEGRTEREEQTERDDADEEVHPKGDGDYSRHGRVGIHVSPRSLPQPWSAECRVPTGALRDVQPSSGGVGPVCSAGRRASNGSPSRAAPVRHLPDRSANARVLAGCGCQSSLPQA
jgi:hypothetical protein